jgi:hypothetical protein
MDLSRSGDGVSDCEYRDPRNLPDRSLIERRGSL